MRQQQQLQPAELAFGPSDLNFWMTCSWPWIMCSMYFVSNSEQLDILKTRHLPFRLLAGSARQLDTVFRGNGSELTLQPHVIQHHKASIGPNGRGVRLLLRSKSALDL
jgi:hypothetical protein